MNWNFYFIVLAFSIFVAPCQSTTPDTSFKIPEEIERQVSKQILHKAQFWDSKGRHILILSRNHEKFSDGKEIISLNAQQFVNYSLNWEKEWTIKDFVECLNLDIEANFFLNLTSFTDLDSNKIYETIVAYSLICAGGIEPKTIKVIMRQGNTKYAIRGESLVKIGDNENYVGKYKPDELLAAKPIFLEFLTDKWKRAAGY